MKFASTLASVKDSSFPTLAVSLMVKIMVFGRIGHRKLKIDISDSESDSPLCWAVWISTLRTFSPDTITFTSFSLPTFCENSMRKLTSPNKITIKRRKRNRLAAKLSCHLLSQTISDRQFLRPRNLLLEIFETWQHWGIAHLYSCVTIDIHRFQARQAASSRID